MGIRLSKHYSTSERFNQLTRSGHPSSRHETINGIEPFSVPQKYSSKW